ncbi:MAG: ureidoglycolate lyase [Alphaproteobacteria bacterium]|nr:MAG: ureidoglycolate lyase [Alphaproteobacteria bacterium]
MKLLPRPISHDVFAPFGELIDIKTATGHAVNDGTSERLHDLCTIDTLEAGGRPGFSVFRAEARQLPLKIDMLERHPLSSQAFIPLGGEAFLVVVAPPGDTVKPSEVQAFALAGGQGINFARGTWHFPLIALAGGDFAVIDRIAEDENCDILQLTDEIWLAAKQDQEND